MGRNLTILQIIQSYSQHHLKLGFISLLVIHMLLNAIQVFYIENKVEVLLHFTNNN